MKRRTFLASAALPPLAVGLGASQPVVAGATTPSAVELPPRFAEAVVGFVGSTDIFHHDQWSTLPQEEAIQRRGRAFFAPPNFFARTVGAKISVPDSGDRIVLNGSTIDIEGPVLRDSGAALIPVTDVAEAVGLKVYLDERGLIVMATTSVVDRSADQPLVTQLIDWFFPDVADIAGGLTSVDNFSAGTDSAYEFSTLGAAVAAGLTWHTTGNRLQPTRNRQTVQHGVWHRKGMALRPGQAVSIRIKIPRINGCAAGLAIGTTTVELSGYSANFASKSGFFYVRDGLGHEWDVTRTEDLTEPATMLLIRGSGVESDKFTWLIRGSGIYAASSFNLPDAPEQLDVGPAVRLSEDVPLDSEAYLQDFRSGTLDKAPEFHQAMNLPWFTKVDHVDTVLTDRYAPLWSDEDPPWNRFRDRIALVPTAGEITDTEVQAVKQYVKELLLPTSNVGNALLAFGQVYHQAMALGDAYEVTGDQFFLDALVRFADRYVWLCNDPRTGVTQYTGRKERTWEHHGNSYYRDGQFVVNTDIAAASPGQVPARTAKLILQNASLAHRKVAFGDPFKFGTTYRDRAKTYVRVVGASVDSFVLKYFLQHDRGDNIFRGPNVAAGETPISEDEYRDGEDYAWNREFMTIQAMATAAESLKILGAADQAVRFRTVAKANIDYFFDHVTSTTANGSPALTWKYANWEKAAHEDNNHGAVDAHALVAFEELSLGVGQAQLEQVGNTFTNIMWKGSLPDDHRWSWYINGTGKLQEWLAPSAYYLQLASYYTPLFARIANKSRRPDHPSICTQLWKHRRSAGIQPEGPQLASIIVDGQPLEMTVWQRDYQVPWTQSAPPSVKATGPGKIVVERASTAAQPVTITCTANGAVSTYRIYFVNTPVVVTPEDPEIPVAAAIGSVSDWGSSNIANVIDNDPSTAYSMTSRQLIRLDLGSSKRVTALQISRPYGDQRREWTQIERRHSASWTPVFYGLSRGTTTDWETYWLADSGATQYVRIVSWGSDHGGAETAISGIRVFG